VTALTALACPACRAPLTPPTSACVACGQAVAGTRATTLESIEFVILGEPIPQGSMRAIRPGVVVSDNPKLRSWRKQIIAVTAQVCGAGWEPWDDPVAVDAVFTVPRPKSAPKRRLTFPAVKPDLDKLTRAIGDSLCPKTGFKVLNEDSRIVEYGQLAKTYPAPMNTHPGALPEPGVRIRVRRLAIL
jgi:Holliday junction resolvase RusA-like endonuclease